MQLVHQQRIPGGVIATGVILIMVAFLGFYGTKNHNQAALFFLIVSGWLRSDEAIKWDAQKAFGCCGLEIVNEQNTTCKKLPCHDECKPCLPVIVDVTSRNLSRVGLLGLLFSFSEIAGVWLAYRFRNIRDPEPRMLPDLSPHLHTRECNVLIELLKKCYQEKTIGRYFGKCSYWDEAVWQCTKKERILRRNSNPRYKKPSVELRSLPESHWTPALKKLKEEGRLSANDTELE
ncbi:hypothetical protein DICVIV_01305 [Dictyocaulus viviparus]|uniref:Tetraspanin family protein n=1 Tax=Dictyocaulus viviparus TaxID=29172 RepID=A0A0D8Y6V3_DICVI|nr:hypothetical protein DICVIV_01305 [Dictyocaulus viviparus]